jgi:hypothetical protein
VIVLLAVTLLCVQAPHKSIKVTSDKTSVAQTFKQRWLAIHFQELAMRGATMR